MTEEEKTSLVELLTDEDQLSECLDEINSLKREMYEAQEIAMQNAAEPFLERIEELETIIKTTHRMMN